MTTRITLNPTLNSRASYKTLGPQWWRHLQNQLQLQGLDVQVRTLGVTGVRAADEYPTLNTLGIEIEGADARKNAHRICAYVEGYFMRTPLARVRNGTNNTTKKILEGTINFQHPVTNDRMFPITQLVVKI